VKGGIAVLVYTFVKIDWRTWKAVEYGIEKKTAIARRPNAVSLVRRIKIQALLSILVNKPGYILGPNLSLISPAAPLDAG
jgi:hypothetical protein